MATLPRSLNKASEDTSLQTLPLMAQETAPTVHRTEGKTNLDWVYDQTDPYEYFQVHGGLDYIIADSTGRINRRAVQLIKQKSGKAVCAELCAGYGLSSATMGSQLTCRDVYDYYEGARDGDAWMRDHKFFKAAWDTQDLKVYGVDIASNALHYGQKVNLFDDTVSKNLETHALSADEKRRLQDTNLCTATGAFSYITTNTLEQFLSCWSSPDDYPCFMFFPLVATPMKAIRDFCEARGMQVYFEPTQHWLPQRRFKDEAEKRALEAAMVQQIGAFTAPACARNGYLHATPFIAVPKKFNLTEFVNQVLGAQEGNPIPHPKDEAAKRRTQTLMRHLASAVSSTVDKAGEDHNTAGKHNFDNVYDAQDIVPYIKEMIRVGYEIGDHTANITRRALDVLPKERHVVLELCAGYGLSMAPILSTQESPKMFSHYDSASRSSSVVESRKQDKSFFASAARPAYAGVRVVAQDVAANALEYGHAVGLYHDLMPRNLETDAPTVYEAQAMAGVGLCCATGAFSYISVKTLENVFNCFDSAPLFLFFPLIATPMDEIAAFLKSKGLQVYYEPSKHWLPQRRYSSPQEQQNIEATIKAKLGDVPRPQSSKQGYIHSIPFIAAPAHMDLKTVIPQLLGSQYA